jgi:putative ABC transport system permease protein
MLDNYLKIAFKVMLRRKFYTFVSLFGIAFTLLVLNVVVAILDHSLTPGAPESELGRILHIERAMLRGEHYTISSNAGYALLDRYARGLPGVEKMSVVSNPDTVTSFVNGRKIEPTLRRTDGAYWEILDFEFLEGGPFTAADEERRNFVAVINATTRERFFAGDDAVGRTLSADGQTFTVVGVVRDVPLTRILSYGEIWVPISTHKATEYRRKFVGRFSGILLAENPTKFPQIKDEFRSRLSAAESPDPELFDTLESGAFTRFELAARSFFSVREFDRSPTRRMVLVCGLGVLLFMLLPALNLINLNLSRILERSSEIGVRKAFGASSWVLVGQFLVESIVLTVMGGLIGLLASAVVLDVIHDSDLLPYAQLSLNVRIFLYGLGLALVFAVFSGAYPAWRMSRLHPVEALHGRA